jgi:putative nucleotidyltransferase-like protein
MDVRPSTVAHDLARRGLVRAVALALAPLGIPVMPLKGALFAYWLYDSPYERFGVDVDLLVPEASFETAIAALRAVGIRSTAKQGGPSFERTLVTPSVPIEIDLHCALFTTGRYRLTAGAVFARSTPNESLFSVPVVLPDPYDAYAHLIGHEAASRFTSPRPHIGKDFALLVARCRLDARQCARHLDDCGLARAARYTLGLFAPTDQFAADVLRSLAPDPVGLVLVKLARIVALRRPEGFVWARVASHLTDASLLAAGTSGIGAVLFHLRRRVFGDPVRSALAGPIDRRSQERPVTDAKHLP